LPPTLALAERKLVLMLLPAESPLAWPCDGLCRSAATAAAGAAPPLAVGGAEATEPPEPARVKGEGKPVGGARRGERCANGAGAENDVRAERPLDTRLAENDMALASNDPRGVDTGDSSRLRDIWVTLVASAAAAPAWVRAMLSAGGESARGGGDEGGGERAPRS
jgi:hypothetical protein